MKVGFSALSNSSYHVIPQIQKQLMLGIHEAGGTPIVCRKIQETRGLDSFVLVNSLPLRIQKEIFENVQQYWTFLLDAPFHHAGWIWMGPQSVNYAVVDPSHLNILSLLNRSGVFFPHGGDTHAFRPWKNRDIDILFMGTAPNLLQLHRQIEQFSLESRAVAKQLVQESLASPELPLLEILISFLKQSGKNMAVNEAMSVLTWSDHMVRATQRHSLLQAFSEFSVVIAGMGWDEIDLSPNHRWIGEVPYQNVAELMSRAKIVLGPNCGFTQGAHDRLLTAMGSGAIPLTMSTPYLTQHFQHGVHLAYFAAIQEAVDLAGLILNGSHWTIVGEAGHVAVADGHSWVQRGKELLTLLQQQNGTRIESQVEALSLEMGVQSS